MSASATITSQIQKYGAKVFRKAYIKRRNSSTGLFESDWQEITKYVKKWGKIKTSIDDVRRNKFSLNNIRLTLTNDKGTFNDYLSDASLWYNYAPRARSLIKIEAGFYEESVGSNLIYTRQEYPSDTTMFIGVIDSDINLNTNNEAIITGNSLLQIFRDYPASNLNFTLTGQTAQLAIETVRDHTDGSGNFIFRPFFNDTTSNWLIDSTTTEYLDLNTGAAQLVRDISTWEMIENLAEAENKVVFIDRFGKFHFEGRDANTTAIAYQFHGDEVDPIYGTTITKVNKYKDVIDKFYSRIIVKFDDADTSTSRVDKELTLTVSGTNNSWLYGQKNYLLENIWIQNTTSAETVRDTLYDELTVIKKEIEFNTTFVPHLSLLDKINVTYKSSLFNNKYLWDIRNWADGDEGTELFWASSDDPWDIKGEEFKISSIEIDLDNFRNTFKCREI